MEIEFPGCGIPVWAAARVVRTACSTSQSESAFSCGISVVMACIPSGIVKLEAPGIPELMFGAGNITVP